MSVHRKPHLWPELFWGLSLCPVHNPENKQVRAHHPLPGNPWVFSIHLLILPRLSFQDAQSNGNGRASLCLLVRGCFFPKNCLESPQALFIKARERQIEYTLLKTSSLKTRFHEIDMFPNAQLFGVISSQTEN